MYLAVTTHECGMLDWITFTPGKQSFWDQPGIQFARAHYSQSRLTDRFLPAAALHSGDWLLPLPISIAVAVALRLGCSVCVAHGPLRIAGIDTHGLRSLNTKRGNQTP